MRFGVYLPTFAWRDLRLDQAARVKAFARKAEELGFDALWVAEHFLEAPGLYGTVWMSPLLCLAYAASVTSRIRLATGLLIAPYYHPVTLAREIQTLWFLSGGRFVLGIGPGWGPARVRNARHEARGARSENRRDHRGAPPPPDRARRELRGPLLPLPARDDRAAPAAPSRAVGGRGLEDPYLALARQALRRTRGAEPDRRRRRLARPRRRQPTDGQGRRPRHPRALRQDRTRPEFAAVRSSELPAPGGHERPRAGATAAAPDLRARDGHASDVRESPAVVLPRDDARDRRADPGSRGGGRPGHGPGHLRLRPRAARAVRDRHRPPVRARALAARPVDRPDSFPPLTGTMRVPIVRG